MADENSRRFPRQWWVLALFAVSAGVAVWQQFVRIPFSTPMYGLFHNQIDAEVYRKGGEIVAHGGGCQQRQQKTVRIVTANGITAHRYINAHR